MNEEWQWEVIERRAHGLSPGRPVSAWFGAIPQRYDAIFDMHYALEVGVVCTGRMGRQYRDYEIVLSPGDAWFCGMWEPHGHSVTKAPCEILVLEVLPEMLANTHFEEAPRLDWLSPFVARPQNRPCVSAKRRRKVADAARRLGHVVMNKGESQPAWLRVCTLELLLLLMEDWLPPRTRDVPASNAYARIDRAVRLVFEGQRLVLAEEAASACGMNRRVFDRQFRELMGISFAKFDLRFRVSGAATQLVRTRDPVKAVCVQWGFTDPSHLNRCFMLHYGCSPTTYRNRFEK